MFKPLDHELTQMQQFDRKLNLQGFCQLKTGLGFPSTDLNNLNRICANSPGAKEQSELMTSVSTMA